MFKKSIALILAMAILFFSCSSTTEINSVPKGAKVYINDEFLGTTPCVYQDSKIMFTTNRLRIEKEGYKIFYTSFTRDEEAEVGAIVGGFFLVVPFLWAMKYKPAHTYELIKLDDNNKK